jgi:hypothetical protein
MKHLTTIALGALTLSACANPAQGDEAAATPADPAAGVAAVSVESIAATRKAPVDDQFISCVQETANGNTYSQFYLIKDGAVKSYSKIQNYARPMCDPGQPGCALGWQGEQVALFFETASGAVNQMLIDLDTMTQSKRLTTASRGVEETTMQCTSGPYPDGVTID